MSVARVVMTLEEMGPRLFGLVYLACPLPAWPGFCWDFDRQDDWCARVSAASSALAVAPDGVSRVAEAMRSPKGYDDLSPDYTRLRDLMRQRADFVVVPPLGDCARLDFEIAEARSRCMPVWHVAEARP